MTKKSVESQRLRAGKVNIYFPDDMTDEIKREAARLGRSISWVVRRAWKIAQNEIQEASAPEFLRRETASRAARVENADLLNPAAGSTVVADPEPESSKK